MSYQGLSGEEYEACIRENATLEREVDRLDGVVRRILALCDRALAGEVWDDDEEA